MLGREGLTAESGLDYSNTGTLALADQELILRGDITGNPLFGGTTQSQITLIGEGGLSSPISFEENEASLGRLSLNRDGLFDLGSDLSLFNVEDTALVLNQGVLNTGADYRLTLAVEAKVASQSNSRSGASDNSYVDGSVEKQFAADDREFPFFFPTGKNGELGELGIASVLGNGERRVKVEYFDDAHPQADQNSDNIFLLSRNSPYYLNRVSDEGWWLLEQPTNDSIQVIVPWDNGALAANSQLVLSLIHI